MTRISPATFARLEARVKELETRANEFLQSVIAIAAEVGQIRRSIDYERAGGVPGGTSDSRSEGPGSSPGPRKENP